MFLCFSLDRSSKRFSTIGARCLNKVLIVSWCRETKLAMKLERRRYESKCLYFAHLTVLSMLALSWKSRLWGLHLEEIEARPAEIPWPVLFEVSKIMFDPHAIHTQFLSEEDKTVYLCNDSFDSWKDENVGYVLGRLVSHYTGDMYGELSWGTADR